MATPQSPYRVGAEPTERLVGANAIIGMRYDTCEFMQGTTEVLVYGTAVWIETPLPR